MSCVSRSLIFLVKTWIVSLTFPEILANSCIVRVATFFSLKKKIKGKIKRKALQAYLTHGKMSREKPGGNWNKRERDPAEGQRLRT